MNLTQKADKIIKDKVIMEFPLIKVREGACRINFYCHQNAVHEAIMAGEDKFSMVMQVCKKSGKCILHFINVNKDGEYFDNTIGVWSRTYDYYFIRDIIEEEFFDILKVFDDALDYFKKELPWYIRWFTDYRV